MSRYTAAIALYPGPMVNLYCGIWVSRGGAFDETVMGPADLTIRTDDPDRRSKVLAEADTVLAEAGYLRTAAWCHEDTYLWAHCTGARRGRAARRQALGRYTPHATGKIPSPYDLSQYRERG